MGFNKYAAGSKVYGGGRPMPTIGPVDPMGYRERDAKAKTLQTAALRRLQARQGGKFISANNLRGGN